MNRKKRKSENNEIANYLYSLKNIKSPNKYHKNVGGGR
jgi:hypothetical protein